MPGAKQPESIADLRKSGLITTGADKKLIVTFVPTGIKQLDEILGGGIAESRIIFMVGKESAGKTLLSQFIAAAYQQAGKTVALVDAEQTYDPEWWAATGVDTDALLVSRPPHGEAAVNVIVALVGEEVDLIILDSGAALVPLNAQDANAEDNNVAGVSRVHKKLFDRLINKLSRHKTSLIILNQYRAAIGSPDPSAVTYPGGDAQRYWASQALRISRGGWITGSEGVRLGIKMGVYCFKNKVAKAFRSCELPFTFEGKFDMIALSLADAIDRAVIKHAGAYYRIPEAIEFATMPDNDSHHFGPAKAEPGYNQVMSRDNLHFLFMNNPTALVALNALVYDGH